jgi:hypothetical protein
VRSGVNHVLPDVAHLTVQRDFHAALWQQEPPAGLTAPDPHEVALRFKIYRNNVQHSLTRALAARFPVTERLVGAEFFSAMACVFIATSPPVNPVVLRWGATFGAFLDQFPPVAHLPFLGDVARLEYARGHAYHAADADPIAPEALNAPDLDLLRLVLHPSVVLFVGRFGAAQIWQSHQAEFTRGPILQGEDHVLIARQPDFAVIVERLDPDTFAVLLALQNGEPLGRAAAAADPTPALTLLLRHGLIIATETGAPT